MPLALFLSLFPRVCRKVCDENMYMYVCICNEWSDVHVLSAPDRRPISAFLPHQSFFLLCKHVLKLSTYILIRIPVFFLSYFLRLLFTALSALPSIMNMMSMSLPTVSDKSGLLDASGLRSGDSDLRRLLAVHHLPHFSHTRSRRNRLGLDSSLYFAFTGTFLSHFWSLLLNLEG